ncbi:MAG: DNA polymerase domain-containing protein [Candidatus Nanoarchaeia archaeon]
MLECLFRPCDARISSEGIVLLGLTTEGKRIAILDKHYLPWLLIEEQFKDDFFKKCQQTNIAPEHIQVEGKYVKCYFKPRAFLKAAQICKNAGLKAYNFDISLRRRYFVEGPVKYFAINKVSGTPWLQHTFKTDISVISDELVSLESYAKPKILAFDIETASSGIVPNPKKDPIISISLYSDTTKLVLMWKPFPKAPSFVQFCNSEAELLKKFFDFVNEANPDLLVGYGTDNFDLAYLRTRAKKYGMSFDFGWAPSKKERDFVGLQYADISRFIRSILDLDVNRYGLDLVAKVLLGSDKGKLANLNPAKINEIWSVGLAEELCLLAEYNLRDSQLVYEITESLLPTCMELSRLTKLSLKEVLYSSYSSLVEWYIIANTNIPIPPKPTQKEIFERSKKTFEGGFVVEPKTGLHENLFYFDFRSLYPSIIATHNISPETINCSCCEPQKAYSAGEVWFCAKKSGFLPELVKDLIVRRKRINEILAKTPKSSQEYPVLFARQHALKYIAAAIFGYLGFAGSRFYCYDCARAITYLGRKVIDLTIGEATKYGYSVLYGDTDGFFAQGQKDPIKFLQIINSVLPKPMELELKAKYLAGLFFGRKAGQGGAKKRYVLLKEDGELILRGVEAVRSDWSKLAKETQIAILRAILIDKDVNSALKYLRKVIQNLKERKVNLDDLALTAHLSKKLSAYAARTPYVAAAELARAKGIPLRANSVIKYIVTESKSKIKVKLLEDASLSDYDVDYYINHQVIKAVYKIFEIFGISTAEFSGQQTLEGYG